MGDVQSGCSFRRRGARANAYERVEALSEV